MMKLKCFLSSFFILSVILSYAQLSLQSPNIQEILHSQKEEISLLLKVESDISTEHLNKVGKIGSRVGNVLTYRVERNQMAELLMIPGIFHVEMAGSILPNLERVIPDVRADSVYEGYGLETRYTGKDVIIGVTDWGFDYTHPMFYDTALKYTRILAAWDQFKTSGPHPVGFDYGTEYAGEDELLAAEKDTINIYGYATHGTHVAGIAGGGGAGTVHQGVAYESDFLFATFLADEAAVIDAFVWMKEKAEEYNKRLVINMSWGLYNLGPLDGTSLVSQAIDQLSEEGVLFVTSGGNNGDVDFHIKKTFNQDTLRTRVDFYPFNAHPDMWGQSISLWGEKDESFQVGFDLYDASGNILQELPFYNTEPGSKYVDSFAVIGSDTIFYNAKIDKSHPLNGVPHVRLLIQNKTSTIKVALKVLADQGTVHIYNVVELTTDVGNWGMPLVAWKQDWTSGDNAYSLGEPASTRSVITVAAHQSEIRIDGQVRGGGFIAPFSSLGPTVDERMKPDVSAPGVNVASSVSSFTDRNFELLMNINFQGKNYPFSRFSGTSMSGPAVAGIVALMLQADPQLYSEDAKRILHTTAREDIHTGDLSENGDVLWGWGKVNAYAAVSEAEQKFLGTQALEKNPLSFYPNPAKDFIVLYLSAREKVGLYNLQGQQVFEGYTDLHGLVRLPTLKKGLYFLKSEDGSFMALKVFIE